MLYYWKRKKRDVISSNLNPLDETLPIRRHPWALWILMACLSVVPIVTLYRRKSIQRHVGGNFSHQLAFFFFPSPARARVCVCLCADTSIIQSLIDSSSFPAVCGLIFSQETYWGREEKIQLPYSSTNTWIMSGDDKGLLRLPPKTQPLAEAVNIWRFPTRIYIFLRRNLTS